eukprot:gene24358-30687_t
MSRSEVNRYPGVFWTDKTISALDRHAPQPSGFDLMKGNEVERCGARGSVKEIDAV